MVPRLLNRLHDKIVHGVLDAGGLKARLFIKACEAKVRGGRSRLGAPVGRISGIFLVLLYRNL